MNSSFSNISLALAALAVLMFVIVTLIVLMGYIYKNKQTHLYTENLIKETQLEKQILQAEIDRRDALDSERIRISADMHDELGSGLSSIKLISHMLKQKHNDTETQTDLDDIVHCATDLTTSMHDIVWSLNPNNDNTQSFADYIAKYAVKFFDPTAIELVRKIKIDVTMPLAGMQRKELLFCVKEILNNIVKHAQASAVELCMHQVNNTLIILISDNGIGRKSSDVIGNGTHTIEMRMTTLGGSAKWLEMLPGCGIELKFPLL
jgi:signal transduction histidine kinase